MIDQFKDIKRKHIGFRVMDTQITSSWSYWDLFCDGRWEPKTLDLIDALLPRGGLMFDIGAWIGPMSLWAAKNRDAEVLALEPDPEAYKQLVANVKANELEHQVICLNQALSADGKPARLAMQNPGDSCSSLTQTGQSSIEVNTITFDELLDYGTPDLIKMDIEGGESLVIPDGMKLSKLTMPIIISLHPQWYAPNSQIEAELKLCNMQRIEGSNYLIRPKERNE
jgi:FkbM family methyltransferase